MEIHHKTVEDIQIISLKGEVDLYSTPRFKEVLQSLIKDGNLWILIDLGAVSYIDSSGLAAIIEALRTLRGRGGSLIICSVKGNVYHAFEIARLSETLPFADNVEAGIKQMRNDKKGSS